MKAMQCERAQELLAPYLDAELEGAARASAAAHIKSCPVCRDLLEDIRRINRAVAQMGREVAPKGLASRIRSSLAKELEQRRRRWHIPLGFGRHVAALAACCALSILATSWILTATEQTTRLEQEIVSAYVRSLLQDNPVQVASSDSHTVKPWFAGRVDFAPDVKDLVADGFPLLGGRLDFVQQRRVGVLVYRRRLHTVNIFMWRTDVDDAAPVIAAKSGYNLVGWTRAGVTYWAVSDLAGDELKRLQSLL
jgi:anti-sigma factor RsiW